MDENNQVFSVSSKEIYKQIETEPKISVEAVIILNKKQEILFSTSKNNDTLKYLNEVDFEYKRDMRGITREIKKFFDDGTMIFYDYINEFLTLAMIFFPDNSLYGETIDYFKDTLNKLKNLLL